MTFSAGSNHAHGDAKRTGGGNTFEFATSNDIVNDEVAAGGSEEMDEFIHQEDGSDQPSEGEDGDGVPVQDQ